MKAGLLQVHVSSGPLLPSCCGSLCRNRRTRARAFGLPGWAGTQAPGAPLGSGPETSAPAFPRPEGSRTGGGGDRGARVRLTCGRAGPGLLSSERGPGGGGEGADSPILPARRPARSFHRAVPRCWSAGPPGPLQLSPPALLLALLLPTGAGPGPGARRLSPTAPQLPDALAERAATAGREGGAPPASWGLERAGPPSRPRRARTQCSAPRPARLVPLGARAAEDAGGLPRPGPALLPGRAPGALLAAPRPQRGREGGIRPRCARQPRKPQPQGRAPRIFQSPSPPPSYCGQAPVDAERQPCASAGWIPGLTAAEARCARGPWRWGGGAAPRAADPGRAEPPAPPARLPRSRTGKRGDRAGLPEGAQRSEVGSRGTGGWVGKGSKQKAESGIPDGSGLLLARCILSFSGAGLDGGALGEEVRD